MTTTPAIARHRAPMPFHRKTSLAAGALYLLTFVSIPTFALYSQIRTDQNYVAGGGADTLVVLGGVLEVIVALACIGTGVALYPIVKRQNEGVALGFVAARILEAAAIFAGVVALLSIVTLRQVAVGEGGVLVGQALLAQNTWTTLLGQGLIPAINAFLLGSLMYRSRLLPRILPVFGFIGAPVLIVGVAGTLFGLWGPVSPVSGIAALCLSVWEFGMGVWLVVKGFNPVAVAKLTAASGDVATSAVRRTLVSHSRAGTE